MIVRNNPKFARAANNIRGNDGAICPVNFDFQTCKTIRIEFFRSKKTGKRYRYFSPGKY